MKIAVIGSGSWASAIVKILLTNVESVNWYIREPEIIDNLNKFGRNPLYLSSIEFDTSKLNLFDDVEKAIRVSDIVLFCVPAAFLHKTVGHINPGLLTDKLIISAIKGIVPEYNAVIADYFKKHFGVSLDRFAIMSGPSHAEEVAREKLTYLTVATETRDAAEIVMKLISGRFIYTSVSHDVYGSEYAPVLKNIMALASGICHSLGYGDNFQAVLISNAIKEIRDFVDVIHPFERDINNSVYLGDLLVTAYSQHSRNRMFGAMIGKGYSVKATQMEMQMVAEGYFAAKCIYEINKTYKVNMPIAEAVYKILYQNSPPAQEIELLAKKLK
jgi:glycerol-3-phosphate dehydrogenase (NAD(P)+)